MTLPTDAIIITFFTLTKCKWSRVNYLAYSLHIYMLGKEIPLFSCPKHDWHKCHHKDVLDKKSSKYDRKKMKQRKRRDDSRIRN